MTRFIHNARFAQMTDEQLKELFKLRLNNQRFDGTITQLDVVSRANSGSDRDPFTVRFHFKSKQYGEDKQFLLFKMFFLDEWDYIHECLEQLNVCPVSEYVLRKKGEITNLECSNRGFDSALTSLKSRVKELYESTK